MAKKKRPALIDLLPPNFNVLREKHGINGLKLVKVYAIRRFRTPAYASITGTGRFVVTRDEVLAMRVAEVMKAGQDSYGVLGLSANLFRRYAYVIFGASEHAGEHSTPQRILDWYEFDRIMDSGRKQPFGWKLAEWEKRLES